MCIVDVDDQIAVGLAVRAVSGERDDDGILRRAGASDERDVLQERRARGHVVALAADLAGARGAALIQRAARIARRAELDGTQAGTIDRLEVADLHGLGLVRGDMVGNGTGVRHDDELAGRDLAAGAVGRVVDGVAARAARRLERHAADVAGRILVARRDGAGQGAGGIDRAGRRQREGEGAGRGARGLLDRVGELAAVEHDVARILLEHQLHILRCGDGDGDLLRAGVLVAVDGGLCRDRRGAAGLGGQRHGRAGAAVQRDHVAAFRYRPADGVGLAGHIGVGLSGRVILLRDCIQRDRIARLYAGRARRDLHIVIAADGDDGRAGLNGAVTASVNDAIETIRTCRCNKIRQIQCRSVCNFIADRFSFNRLVVVVVPSKRGQLLVALSACRNRQRTNRCIELIGCILRLVDDHNVGKRCFARLNDIRYTALREIGDPIQGIKAVDCTLQLDRAAVHKLHVLHRQRHRAVCSRQMYRHILLAERVERILTIADGSRDVRLRHDLIVFSGLPDSEGHGSLLAVDLGRNSHAARARRRQGRYVAGVRIVGAKSGNARIIGRPSDALCICRRVGRIDRCFQTKFRHDAGAIREVNIVTVICVLVCQHICAVVHFELRVLLFIVD